MASKTKVEGKTTREEGERLNAEGKCRRVGADAFEVEGMNGKYLLTRNGIFWVCPCPSRKGDCSHVEAVHAAVDAEMVASTPEPTPEEAASFLSHLGWSMPPDEDEAQGDEQGQLFVL